MLSVEQTRTIQWDRDVAELEDSEMMAIAGAMLNSTSLWTDLYSGKLVSDTINQGKRSILVMCYCLNAEDDLLLQIVNVQ